MYEGRNDRREKGRNRNDRRQGYKRNINVRKKERNTERTKTRINDGIM